jgi:hypothetical protein
MLLNIAAHNLKLEKKQKLNFFKVFFFRIFIKLLKISKESYYIRISLHINNAKKNFLI